MDNEKIKNLLENCGRCTSKNEFILWRAAVCSLTKTDIVRNVNEYIKLERENSKDEENEMHTNG
jgi:hypothetical protein